MSCVRCRTSTGKQQFQQLVHRSLQKLRDRAHPVHDRNKIPCEPMFLLGTLQMSDMQSSTAQRSVRGDTTEVRKFSRCVWTLCRTWGCDLVVVRQNAWICAYPVLNHFGTGRGIHSSISRLSVHTVVTHFGAFPVWNRRHGTPSRFRLGNAHPLTQRC